MDSIDVYTAGKAGGIKVYIMVPGWLPFVYKGGNTPAQQVIDFDSHLAVYR